MSDDETAGPSFILAQHDNAHREHTHSKRTQHYHHPLHKEQERDVTKVVPGTVDVVTTVSVIQQINVDLNGNTINIQTLQADSTGGLSAILISSAITTSYPPSPSSPTSNPEPSPPPSPPAPAPESTSISAPSPIVNPSSLLSVQDVQNIPTSTPLLSSTFASLIPNTNTTIPLPTTISGPQTFTNSSIASTSASSKSRLSYYRTASSRSATTASVRSTSLLYSPSTSSYVPVATGGIGGVATDAGDQAQPTGSITTLGSDDDPATPTPVVIGGVVGSIAGVAVIVLALLFIWRWKKRGGVLPLGNRTRGAEAIDDEPPSAPSGPTGGMSEARALPFSIPAALAGLTGHKRNSERTEKTISSTAGSERGFYRVSGRKLPSVLQTGGDGYGGGIPDDNTLSGASFYRDSRGFYGGAGGPSSPLTPPIGISMQRAGLPEMRPGPARTPVIEHSPYGTSPDFDPPPRRDLLGRSHPSQDGSHASKFTEEV